MINRLVEPSAGRIVVEGQDVTATDPVQLRRRIGYVIQGVGLFPHLSVAENGGTVPRLLRWPAARISARTDEMLRLVGLDPFEFRDRRPHSLSGGQRQRVGVARALAADPPVMLMDEPFGAVDPVARARLQQEFGAILRGLGKTVVMVTHDIDEAIRMGDRLAIMEAGRIVQYGRPLDVLARPATSFVADFLGPDRGLRRLSLLRVRDVVSSAAAPTGAPEVEAGASLQVALAALIAAGSEAAAVRDNQSQIIGSVTLQAIRAAGAAPSAVGPDAPSGRR
jgi:osmoprotectant transport system ATP-binding protein